MSKSWKGPPEPLQVQEAKTCSSASIPTRKCVEWECEGGHEVAWKAQMRDKLPRKVNRVTLIITNEDPAPNSSQGHEMTAIRPIAVVVKVTVAAWRTPRYHAVPQAWGGYGFHKSSGTTYSLYLTEVWKPP